MRLTIRGIMVRTAVVAIVCCVVIRDPSWATTWITLCVPEWILIELLISER